MGIKAAGIRKQVSGPRSHTPHQGKVVGALKEFGGKRVTVGSARVANYRFSVWHIIQVTNLLQ